MTPYYDDGSVTIYHGDCREVGEWLQADVLVTDPPYGMALRSGWAGAFGDLRIEGDDNSGVRDTALGLWGDRPALVFGRWSVQRPPSTRMVLTWDKGGASGMGDLAIPWKPQTEEIYVIGGGFIGRRSSCVLRYDAPPTAAARRRRHPTEKPLGLMRDLVGKCPPGVVADPFMGSGTTMRAAKDLGRKAIGVELDEAYCEVAARRMGQEVLAL